MTSPIWGFNFRASADGANVDIDVYDVIGESFWGEGVSAKAVKAKLDASKSAKQINLRVNSKGGDVIDGLAIYEQLRGHGGTVNVQVDGIAASMASIIAMAGDTITMASSAFMMIHNPWGVTIGDADEMRATADLLDKMRGTLADIYVARTGQKRKDVEQWMSDETWMTASEALDRGFANKVLPKKKQAEANAFAMFASADLAKFRNVPTELQATLDEAQKQKTTPEPQGRAVPDVGEETETMSLKLILATLSLTAAATEDDAVIAISQLQARANVAAKLENATGKTGEEAVGAVLAFKASHDKLPGVEAELATVRAASDKAELSALIKQGRDDKKLTKAEADNLEAQVVAGTISLAAAKSFVAVMAPKEHLAANPAVNTPAPSQSGAKAYEDHTVDEIARLRSEAGEEAYAALRQDWIARGRPARTQK